MRNFFLLMLVLVATGCAQIVAPVGGEKDTTAPVVLNFDPPTESVNFNSDEIVLTFDEYVQLNDVYNELLISPPLDDRPEIKVRKKSVIIELKEKLKPNTTYTFNFGEGIVDVNERNVANINYVFSTGTFVDSLGIRGVINDAYTNLPVANARILLYTENIDSLPLTARPNYFGRSDENGNWEVPYLKGGEYKVFALKEELGNYIYDNYTESIAFIDSMIVAEERDSLMVEYELRMAKESDPQQFISEWKADSTGALVLILNREPEDLKFRFLDDSGSELIRKISMEKDSVKVWFDGDFPNQELDLIIYDDSLLLDTLEIPLFDKTTQRQLKLKCPDQRFDSQKNPLLRLSSPFIDVDTSKIRLTRDSVQMEFSVLSPDDDCCSYYLKSDFQDAANYELVVLPGAFTANRLQPHDTVNCKFQSYQPDYYSDFYLDAILPDDEHSYLLQFVTKSNKVEYEFEILGSESIHLNRALPGTYTLRLIQDLNGDGEWTTLNYEKERQAEKVFYYQEELSLRTNWEQKLKWELNSTQKLKL